MKPITFSCEETLHRAPEEIAGLEKMFFEVGVPVLPGTTTAVPPTQGEIVRLLAIAPKYGIEIRLPAKEK